MNKNGRVYSDLCTLTLHDKNVQGYGIKQNRNVKYVVIHGTATTNRDVVVRLFQEGSSREASAEYLVTDNEIIGFGGENFIHWHCGGGSVVNNGNAIGIEHINSFIGNIYDPKTQLFSNKTLENGAKLVADICIRYGLKPDRSCIKTHGEIMATDCPQTLNIDDYIKLVQKYYYDVKQKAPVQKQQQTQTQTNTHTKVSNRKEYAENGKFTVTVNEGIYFRNSADTVSKIQGSYEKGESVYYDRVVLEYNGYVYISWISSSTGQRRYMPIKVRKNGKTIESWGDVE